MNSENQKQPEQKQAYHSPNLTVHGELSSLTQQFGSGSGGEVTCRTIFYAGAPLYEVCD